MTRRHGGETGEKGVGRWWVMQCPASLGAGASVVGCTPVRPHLIRAAWRTVWPGSGSVLLRLAGVSGGVEPGEGGRHGRPSAAEHCSTHPARVAVLWALWTGMPEVFGFSVGQVWIVC